MGKSRVIQSVTKYFERQTIPEKLAKVTYTGIVASLIGGKILHVLFGLTVYRAGMTSMQKICQLARYWTGKEYFGSTTILGKRQQNEESMS